MGKIYIGLVGLLFMVSPCRADLSEVMSTSQMAQGESSASDVVESKTFFSRLSISFQTMFLGPSISTGGLSDNSGPGRLPNGVNASSGAGGSKTGRKSKSGRRVQADQSVPGGTSVASTSSGPKPQVESFRHSLSLSYAYSSEVSISPTLDVNEPITGNKAGQWVMNDPQLRVNLKNWFQTSLFNEVCRSNLVFAYYAPLSSLSKSNGSQGALSVSTSPHLYFSQTRFSLGGSVSMKTGFYNPQGNTELVSSKLFGSVQVNYQISKPLETFVTTHTTFPIGPHVTMADAGLSSQTFTPERAAHTVGIMTGMKAQLTKTISVTPRLNWFLDQPIQSTTVGMNLNIRLM